MAVLMILSILQNSKDLNKVKKKYCTNSQWRSRKSSRDRWKRGFDCNNNKKILMLCERLSKILNQKQESFTFYLTIPHKLKLCNYHKLTCQKVQTLSNIIKPDFFITNM